MKPQVIAGITNYAGIANGNAAATALLKQARAITRIWQKFKTAQ